MFIFGHIGITVGVVKACAILVPGTKTGHGHWPHSGSKTAAISSRHRLRLGDSLNEIKSRIGLIDYRVVALGSLFPDVIDKPVWLLAIGDISPSGRGYAHTLLFNLALLVAGLILIRYRKSWLLLISLSSLMHLIFDQMWRSPARLLWPLLGPLLEEETTGWLSNIIQALFTDPKVYIPEIIGLVIVLLFAYRIVTRKRVTGFIRNGAID